MNNKDTVFTLSLLRLISEGKLNAGHGNLYKDDCFVVINPKQQELEESSNMFLNPTRLDCYILFLCADGELDITCNMQHTTIKPHMVFFTHPGSIIQSQVRSKITSAAVLLNEHFIERLNISVKNLLPHMGSLNEMNSFTLNAQQFSHIWRQVEMLSESIRLPSSLSYHDEVVQFTIKALAYNFVSLLIRELEKRGNETGDLIHSNEEDIFRRFIRLVSEHYRTERRISYYADCMHLTPKYMSSVVRRVSGHGPSEWITQNVMIEAKNLLKYSNISIQEVAYTLNFPNQSFFGRWFKTQTGMSPKAYRENK